MSKHGYGFAVLVALLAFTGCNSKEYVVLAHNDLGMHCMNQDFSEFMILPPYNVVHAQVLKTGSEPEFLTSGIEVKYSIPGNTTSSNKTNFWTYVKPLMGVDLAADVGLTGNGLSGSMTAVTDNNNNEWVATGIPVTPIMDDGTENAYPLAKIVVTKDGAEITSTESVVPVSWEISCNICHKGEDGGTPGMDILRQHDEEHDTNLAGSTPVMCGKCHGQPALNAPGKSNLPTLSSAMHSSHASRMNRGTLDANGLTDSCYACHPGKRTQCLRDIHFKNDMTCKDCHGEMSKVGDSSRRPWVDEPKCGDCHKERRPDFEFEQADTLFRNSKGHHGVNCISCHGSPHAIEPTVVEADNRQAVAVQGSEGVIKKCSVCHGMWRPEFMFDHKFSKAG